MAEAGPYDDFVLAPPPDLVFPVPGDEFRHGRRGVGAWAEYLGLRAAQLVAVRLPEALLRPLVGSIARVAAAADRRHTRAARRFVEAALPDRDPAERERLVLGAWRHLVHLAVENERIARLAGRRLGDCFDVVACEGFEELRRSGQGCLFVTAHVGVWEAIGLPLIGMGFSPVYAIGKPPRNDPLARYIQRRREATGGRVIARRGAMRSVPAVVRAGGSVVMLLDQRARKKPVFAPLFGRPAACDRSAGVLVRRVGAPIVFAACYNTAERGRYRVVFSRIVRPEELSGMSPEAVMTLVNRESERLILAEPDQYFWLHDRYKGAPDPRLDAAGAPIPTP